MQKMKFVGRLPHNIDRVAANSRTFTSDRGLWRNTVLQRVANTNNAKQDCRGIQAWVPDKKDGYRTQKEVSTKQHVIDGFKLMKTEFKLWKNEIAEHLRADPLLIFRPGECSSDLELNQWCVEPMSLQVRRMSHGHLVTTTRISTNSS